MNRRNFQSKMCLNIHHYQSKEGVNPRTFEILGAGGFQLIDYKKILEELFDIDKELVCYRGIEELVEKIIYYLDRDEERNIIAKAGHQRVLKEHTIRHRVERILTDIARL